MVAGIAKINRMLVSQIVTKLNQKNLVKRLIGNLDKRPSQIFLTPKGADLLVEYLPIVEDHGQLFFAVRATP